MNRFTLWGTVDPREGKKGFSDPDGGMGFLGGMAGGISSGRGGRPLGRDPDPDPIESPRLEPEQSLNLASGLSRMYRDSLM